MERQETIDDVSGWEFDVSSKHILERWLYKCSAV
jgi:hypothetical protein